MNDKYNKTNNNKEEKNFKKKNIKHNPQAESSRAKFGMNKEKNL